MISDGAADAPIMLIGSTALRSSLGDSQAKRGMSTRYRLLEAEAIEK
ncbi:hypothetical protein [Parageobacillus thermoglucosidasius]|nr:hypothetical protein [Parageobacillus thermoglucosidasius]GCD82920.1 hypothetical protein PTHTG4_19830 [Parageobacillus thermoglucosidasius]